MISYQDLVKHFGSSLSDKDLQSFLANLCSDLTDYNILEHDYIISQQIGIEFGFTNNSAVYEVDEGVVFENGNPVFTHFVLHPKSSTLIIDLPFDVNFTDNRIAIIKKAGNPSLTKEGYIKFLEKDFLVDNYKVGDIIITFDYDTEKKTINHIQVRDNNLAADHLKL
ncbi:hypothetical protein [Ferruginibacter albus]|uniref:hypothetical protein n=1 Tax=Ferruginibacter albus TaxID=2875540 RepID=UPI001CC5BCEF|nr:hypothetical protein [Ferruginibacter albus]UAY50900.1 hypothetical protein K9M53_09890 [Ferruginibacter albus]